jgi:hypothetical protein
MVRVHKSHIVLRAVASNSASLPSMPQKPRQVHLPLGVGYLFVLKVCDVQMYGVEAITLPGCKITPYGQYGSPPCVFVRLSYFSVCKRCGSGTRDEYMAVGLN